MTNNQRNKNFERFIISGQFFFLTVGCFLIYAQKYPGAISAHLLLGGLMSLGIKGNFIITLLNRINLSLGLVTLVYWFYLQFSST